MRLMILALVLIGCGGGGESVDPRCASLCVIEEPPIEGAGDICSQASADLCIDECQVRIADTSSTCATCVLEDASFGDDNDSPGDFCMNGTCTVTGREGECMYPEGDTAAREDCERQVNPRRDVECDTDFRPVEECAALCG